MDVSNLLSGLIGALVGILSTFVLYWHDRYVTAKLVLTDRLYILFQDVFWSGSNLDIYKTWDASIRDLWNPYSTVLYFTPWFRRRSLRKAWENYKGEKREVMEQLELEGMIVDNKNAPKNGEEFVRRIHDFLAALG